MRRRPERARALPDPGIAVQARPPTARRIIGTRRRECLGGAGSGSAPMSASLSLPALVRVSNCSRVCTGYSPLPVRWDFPTPSAGVACDPLAPVRFSRYGFSVLSHFMHRDSVCFLSGAVVVRFPVVFRSEARLEAGTSLWPSPALSVRCVPSSPNTALGATCHRIPVRIVRVVSCPLRRLRHLGSRRICAQRRRCMVNSNHVVRFRASPTLGRHGDGDS